ncbi:MAG: 50S ribosomal protein L18 [Candidatus Kerfeldbacteria bacterium]
MKDVNKDKDVRKSRRKRKVRAKVFGTKKRPRASVKRSLKHISVQIIDDDKGHTLISTTDIELKNKKLSGIKIAKEVGMTAAKKAKEAKITEIVFDRKGNKYHGRVKALAEGLREGGLKF